MTTTEKRLATLEPSFKPKIEVLLHELEQMGIKCVVTSARRTMAEQAKLYAQGRTTHGAIVTKADKGQSSHNFGLAVDLAPLNAAGEIDWDANDDIWQVIARTAEKNGLEAGYFWKSFVDKPHIQDRNWKVAQAAWKRGEIQVV